MICLLTVFVSDWIYYLIFQDFLINNNENYLLYIDYSFFIFLIFYFLAFMFYILDIKTLIKEIFDIKTK